MFIPYIYSKTEIKKIFHILKNDKNNKNELLIYTCISILYCCGLRIGELTNLKLKDFDIYKKILTIKNGKNNVTRLIPLTEELVEILNKYINNNFYLSDNEFIFLNKITRRYLAYIIRSNFKKIIIQAGILNTYKNKVPRLHDLRHTFAIHTLNNMLEQGFELYQCLPTLSVYLGHSSVYETEYYLVITNYYKEFSGGF